MEDNNNIVKVYSGKAGKCCCGCSGKYSYASWSLDSDSSAYNVDDRAVRSIANKVLNDPDSEHDDFHSSLEIGNRILIVYYS